MDNKTNVYRNYSSTQQKIAMLNTLRITTREEAIAFLRGVANINAQIAEVLQRDSLRNLAAANRARVAEQPKNEEVAPVIPVETAVVSEEPVFKDEESHTKEEADARVAQLKKAKKA